MTLSITASTVLSGIIQSVAYFDSMLSIIMLSVVMLKYRNAECHYAECHSAKCRGVAEIRQASKIPPYGLFLVVLFVFE